MLNRNSTCYEVSIQVPYESGFWTPHTEWNYSSSRFATLTKALHWLVNQDDAYAADADIYVELWSGGACQISWHIMPGRGFGKHVRS